MFDQLLVASVGIGLAEKRKFDYPEIRDTSIGLGQFVALAA